MRSGDIPPPLIDINRGIHINGSPEEGFEALIIDRPSASRFNFCKTARRPYDLVVTTVLLRAYLLAPTQFKLS